MKFLKKAAVIMIIILLFSALTACGSVFDGSETPVDEADSVAADSSNVEEGIADDSSSGTDVKDSGGQTATVQEESTKPVFEEVKVTEEDKAAKIDKYIGNWEDTTDPSRYCIIKKTEIGYSYSDNESTFPAKVENDALMIHIEVEDAYAMGKVDEAAGTLTITYQDQDTVFKKKAE